MKKLIIVLLALFALQTTNVFAQTDDVIVHAILQDVTTVTVVTGDEITFTFATSDDYNLGHDVNTVPSIVEVVALLDWTLSLSSDGDFLNDDGGGSSIPIENLGVWCVSDGVHQFGSELTCAYTTITTPIGVTDADQLLIGNGSGNHGDALDNLFTLNWEMGSMNGSMETLSMFEQIAATGSTIVVPGNYTTTVTLTLTTL